jgi:hypothetical protein
MRPSGIADGATVSAIGRSPVGSPPDSARSAVDSARFGVFGLRSAGA